MLEVAELSHRTDGVDSWPYVAARIAVNEDFAEAASPREASMYARSFDAARRHIALGDTALVLDLGCSNLVPAVRGAALAEVNPMIVGVDIDPDAYRLYPPPEGRFTFVEGDAQDLPLPDDSFDLTQAHNAIFRVSKPRVMLDEMVRVTRPGGLIAISTNAPSHAHWRHRFERLVATQIIEEEGLEIEPPKAPAHGSYLRKMQRMLQDMPRLTLLEAERQQDYAIITEERLPVYQFAIDTSVAQLPDLPPGLRPRWRKIVEERVVPMIRECMKPRRGHDEPVFADRIHRGLFVLKKDEA